MRCPLWIACHRGGEGAKTAAGLQGRPFAAANGSTPEQSSPAQVRKLISGGVASGIGRRSTPGGRKFHGILVSPPAVWNCPTTSAIQDGYEALAKAASAITASAEAEPARLGHDIDTERLNDGSVVKHQGRRVASDGHEPMRSVHTKHAVGPSCQESYSPIQSTR